VVGFAVLIVVALVGGLTDPLYAFVEDPFKTFAREANTILWPAYFFSYVLAAAAFFGIYEYFGIKNEAKAGAVFGFLNGSLVAAPYLYDYATLKISFPLVGLWMIQKMLEFTIAGALYGWGSKKFV
jgi:hypothetical protein